MNTMILALTLYQTAPVDAVFLRSMERADVETVQVARFFSFDSAKKVSGAKLNGEARAHSADWMSKTLKSNTLAASMSSQFEGRKSLDGISKLFVKNWVHGVEACTWIDNGVVAVYQVRNAARVQLNTKSEADHFVEDQLQSLLKLPAVERTTVRYYLDESKHSPGFFSGNVCRDLKTEPLSLPDGRIANKILHELEWHHILTIATDGQTTLVKINFYRADSNLLKRVADPRNRFIE